MPAPAVPRRDQRARRSGRPSSATSSHAWSDSIDRADVLGRVGHARRDPAARQSGEHLVDLVRARLADRHAAAAAISPASRAFATTRSRFAASVRPPLSRCRHASTNGVTAWPCTPSRSAAASACSISGSTSSRLSSGGRPSRSPPPPSSQCACAIARRLAGRSRRAPTPAARRARRRRAAARRCGSRAPARRASRAAPPSPGTSSSDFTPDETTSAGVARERAEVGRDVGRRRPAAVHAAEPARRHEADPGRAADGERAADRRRADRALHDRRGEVARARSCAPTRRSARAPPRSARRRSRRRGRRSSPAPRPPRAPRARTRARPRRPRRAGSRARRASSRARRRRGPRERLAHLVGDADHGIAPSFAQQRAAASSPSLDAADEEAGRERVAGAGRVDDLGRHGRDTRRRRRRPRPRRASRPSARRARRAPRARARSRRRGRARAPAPARGTRRRSASTTRGRARSRAPAARASSPAPQRRAGDRLPHGARSPTRGEHRSGTSPARARPARSSGARAAVGDHRPLARRRRSRRRRPSVRPTGPTTSTPRPRSSPRDELAGRVVAALRHEPRLGAERRRPRGDVRGLPAGADARRRDAVVVGRERLVEARDHVEEQVAEGS